MVYCTGINLMELGHWRLFAYFVSTAS